MSFYRIITDTSANLPTAYLRSHNVDLIPFCFIVNGKENVDLDHDSFESSAFFDLMRSGAKVTTSQITPAVYENFFTPFLEAGEDLLFIAMSSGISGSFASAKRAEASLKEKFPDRRIRMVDTLGASLGEGLLVMRAVEYREEGVPLDDAADRLDEEKKRMFQVFTVDDLKYLSKTGRLWNATAVVGNVLHIKPILKGNEEGRIVTCGKTVGRRRALAALADRYDEYVVSPETQTVGIAHADCLEDAEELAAMLRRKNPPKEILTVMYEPVTGSHVGPGTVALFFLGDENVRSKK